MSFIWPSMLISALLVPLLLGLLLVQRRRAARIRAEYGKMLPTPNGGSPAPARGQRVPWALFLVGLATLTVAMGRPQAQVSLPRLEGTVILAFDVSGSMAADDFKPSRMEAAKAAARAFVDRQPSSVQIGVVAFSDSGFTVQAPTSDRDQVMAAIDRLTPQRGTSLANGILTALNTIDASRNADTHYYSSLTPLPTQVPTPMPAGQYSSASIVLLSDGENNESPDPAAAAHAAADRGIRIYTIGLGSAAGVDLHINGFVVRSRLDEGTLKLLSQLTNGTYFNAATPQDLNRIYDELKPEITTSPKQTELTALLAGGGALLFVLGGMLSLWSLGRVA